MKKMILILCISLIMTTTSGCSLIDTLVQSMSTKTSISLEIAKIYKNYVIAYPIGRVMRSIEPSEPIIIPHKQEDAYQMEFGFVPDVLSYPDDPERPLSGYVYSNENNYLDVSKLDGFDSIPLQLGDQLTVTFDKGGMDLENNTIIAKTIDILSVDDMDFNDLDFSEYIGTSYEAYEDDIVCNDLSVYSLISILKDYGTITCKEGPNEQWAFKGYETIVSIKFEDGTYADISVHQYASHSEMETDASVMQRDGEYNVSDSKEYHFKLGKIIFSGIEIDDVTGYNTNRLMVILHKIAGGAFARNTDNFLRSEEYKNFIKGKD